MNRSARATILALTLAAGAPVAARGAILTWTNAAGGNFGTASNWNPMQAPTTADTCLYSLSNTYTVNYTSALTASGAHTFKRGNVTMNVTASHTAGGIFRVADTSTDNAVTNLTAGAFTVNNLVLIGNSSGSVGTLNVTGTSASFTMGQAAAIVVVGSGSAGSLNVTAGGRYTSAGNIIVGNNAVATGTVQVSGVAGLGSTLRTSNEGASLTIGQSGDGRLDVTDGGVTSIAGNVVLANSTGSLGEATITGMNGTRPSTLEAIGSTSDIIVGDLGQGTLTIRDGGRVTAFQDIRVGATSGGTGTLDIAGTASRVSRVLVGRNLGVGYNDGELPNAGGIGSLIIGANAVVDVANQTQIGDVHGGSALLRITGGQLITRSLFIDEFNVFGTTIDFRGGSIVIDGGSIFFSSNPPFGREFEFGSTTGAPVLTLQGGGSTSLERMSVGTIGSGGGNAALVVTGTGTLLRVQGGTFPRLAVTSPAGSTGSLTVQNGASIDAENFEVWGGSNFGTNSAVIGAGCFVTTTSLSVRDEGASFTMGGAGSRLTTGIIRVGSVGTTGGSLTLQSGCDALVTSTQSSGNSAVEFNANATGTIESGAVLTTAGGVLVRGTLNLTGGTINAVRLAADMYSTGATSGRINAAGTINANLEIINAASVFNATGAVSVGKATDPAGIVNSGGTIMIAAAGNATLLDADLADIGNVQMSAGGRMSAANGVRVASGKTLSGAGTLDATVLNQGTISVTGAMTLGRGTSTSGFSSGGDLVVAGTGVATILDANAADIGDTTLTSPGRVIAANGLTLAASRTLTGSGTVEGDVLNLGSITPTGVGITFLNALTGVGVRIAGTAVRFNGGGSFTGAGSIDADVITDAAATITPTGNLAIGRTSSSTGVSIAGTLLVPGVAVTFRDSTQAQLGVLTELRGGVIIGPSLGTNLTGGTTPDLFRGVGQITGPLSNSGRIQVGLPEAAARIGSLVVSGDFSQTSIGVLDIEIGGTASNARDQLLINGAATLGGTLNVSTINGFVPQPGDVFQIVACSSRTGTFATVNAPGFQVEYLPTSVRLTVPVVCDPDMNQDGNVDQEDVRYLVNVIAGAPNTTGVNPDFNNDGNENQDDVAALINVVAGGPCP
jgi:T5SS/PEP-CTERM-associated repeat protein